MTKTIVTFKPKQAVKELIGVLPVRAQDVLKRRYGLGVYTEKETLEAIGGVYDITRERVRQIENFALSAIRRSPSFDRLEPIFLELKEIMEEYGVLVNEKDFLEHISTMISLSSRKMGSSLSNEGERRIALKAKFSIWRTRSRVISYTPPIASRVSFSVYTPSP
jgi:hypothetical protein